MDGTSKPSRHCVDFCAYHSNFTAIVNGSPLYVPYTVHPDIKENGCQCGINRLWTNMRIAMAHELAEAVTDPVIPRGWTYTNLIRQNEVVDLCVNQRARINITISGETYSHPVSALWSNRAGACVFSAPDN
jgi:hypothetical protein